MEDGAFILVASIPCPTTAIEFLFIDISAARVNVPVDNMTYNYVGLISNYAKYFIKVL